MDLSYKGHCFTEHLSSWAGGHQKNSRGHSWGKEIRFKLFLLLCIQASRVWNNLICLVLSREALRKGKGRSASLSLDSDLSQFSMTKKWYLTACYQRLQLHRRVWCPSSCDQGLTEWIESAPPCWPGAGMTRVSKSKLWVTGKSVSLAIHDPDNSLEWLAHSGNFGLSAPTILPQGWARRTGMHRLNLILPLGFLQVAQVLIGDVLPPPLIHLLCRQPFVIHNR